MIHIYPTHTMIYATYLPASFSRFRDLIIVPRRLLNDSTSCSEGRSLSRVQPLLLPNFQLPILGLLTSLFLVVGDGGGLLGVGSGAESMTGSRPEVEGCRVGDDLREGNQ
jgi:hypothetical protein